MAKKGFEWAGEFHKAEEMPTAEPQAILQPVVTISRQHGSGGREIGRKLAEQLGIPFYGYELIERAAQSSPIDRSFFENAETSGSNSLLRHLSDGVQQNLSVEDQAFLHQAQIIRQVASEGPCVIVGRCADYVLKERPHVVKAFIHADMDSRIHRIVHIYHEADEEALEQIKKTDRRREHYYSYYSGQAFGDSTNYAICLDSSLVGVDTCVKILKDAYTAQLVNQP